jgi:hypothetical protein
VKDVAAPLYRIFLADAHAAARAGEPERVLECIGLALDFVPDTQRERVLLAAADLVPSVSTAPRDASGGTATVPAFVLRVSEEGPGQRESRIAWEERLAQVVLPRGQGAFQLPPLRTTRRSTSRVRRIVVGLIIAAAGITATASARFDALQGRAATLISHDPVEGARAAIRRGDASEALRLLAPLGADVRPEVWLLRASAYEAQADRAQTVRALTAAASRDGEDGRWAMAAADQLARIGALSDAADAYLYAVTPSRTEGEMERIAHAQELAGYPDRAARVRRR